MENKYPSQPIPGSLLVIKTADQLIAEAEQTVKQLEEQAQNEQFFLSLAGDLRVKWEQAKRAKMDVEQRMIRCKRARKAEYDPQKLAAIKALYGQEFDPPYPPVIGTKCRDMEAWMKDFLCKPGTEIWDLQATPLPDLPDSIETHINDVAEQSIIQVLLDRAIQSGQQLSVEAIQMEIDKSMPLVKEKVKKSIQRQAKDSISKMKEKIKDQFAEGGFNKAIKEIIYDIATYPAAFIKGPVQKKSIVRKREMNEAGKWETKIEEQVIDTYERRSPWNIYPMPGAKSIDDGGIFDLISITPKALSMLIDVPGYDSDAIREVKKLYRTGGLKEWTAIDAERAHLEDRDSELPGESDYIDCLEYQGSASGKLLKEWGLSEKEIPDEDKEYEVVAWLIGTHVIKAMLNSNATGKKNIFKASYEDDPDSFWGGQALPEILWDIQVAACAIARSIVLNVSFSAGPIIEYDRDRFPDGVPTSFYPFMKMASTGSVMATGKAINYYMTSYVADRLQGTFEFYRSLADEYSGIPRYMQGERDSASQTASGLSMLISNSTRGLKGILTNIDSGIIAPLVEAQYLTNLEYEDNIELIGDCKAVGKGAASIIAKEQLAIRRKEFLAETNNPVDNQIIGVKGRKELLKAGAEALDMDIEKIFDEEEMLSAGDMGIPQGGTNPSPMPAMAINAAGDRASGQDFALFQNQGAGK